MSIPIERYDEFDESPDELPSPWIFFGGTEKYPLDGPSVVGELLRLEVGVPGSFGDRAVSVIRLKDGTERAIWFHWLSLRNQFRRAKPKPGEVIKVVYEGEKISAKGSDYRDFKVRVARDQAEVNWDDIAQPGDEGEDQEW